MIKLIVRILTSAAFIFSGIYHFVALDSYAKIVPPFLPSPPALVYISGACEVLGGIGLLISKSRSWAATGLIALLIAVFPANLYHALANVQVGGFLNSRLYQWVRLPFQFVFILAVWWVGQKTNLERNRTKA